MARRNPNSAMTPSHLKAEEIVTLTDDEEGTLQQAPGPSNRRSVASAVIRNGQHHSISIADPEDPPTAQALLPSHGTPVDREPLKILLSWNRKTHQILEGARELLDSLDGSPKIIARIQKSVFQFLPDFYSIVIGHGFSIMKGQRHNLISTQSRLLKLRLLYDSHPSIDRELLKILLTWNRKKTFLRPTVVLHRQQDRSGIYDKTGLELITKCAQATVLEGIRERLDSHDGPPKTIALIQKSMGLELNSILDGHGFSIMKGQRHILISTQSRLLKLCLLYNQSVQRQGTAENPVVLESEDSANLRSETQPRSQRITRNSQPGSSTLAREFPTSESSSEPPTSSQFRGQTDVRDSECLICWQKRRSGQRTQKCKFCPMIYHEECLLRWYKEIIASKKCPHCRQR